MKFVNIYGSLFNINAIRSIDWVETRCGYEILLTFFGDDYDKIGIITRIKEILYGQIFHGWRLHDLDIDTDQEACEFCVYFASRLIGDQGIIVEFEEILEDFHHGRNMESGGNNTKSIISS